MVRKGSLILELGSRYLLASVPADFPVNFSRVSFGDSLSF